MNLSNKIAVLLCTLGIVLFSSCKKNDNTPEIDVFKNTEWRGKVNLDGAVNKNVAYYVIKFFDDKTFRISAADTGGMIYKDLETGSYEFIAEDMLILHLTEGGELVFSYRERGSQNYIYAGHYGVNMYRQ